MERGECEWRGKIQFVSVMFMLERRITECVCSCCLSVLFCVVLLYFVFYF